MEDRSSVRRVRSTWPVLATIAGIVLIAVVIVGVVIAGGSGESLSGQAPADDEASGPATSLAEYYAATMTAIATDAAEYPPEQGTQGAEEVQAVFTARADPHLSTKPAHPMPPTENPDSTAPHLQAGIVNGVQQGPFSSGQFEVRNFWQGPTERGWMLVYAGATRSIADGSRGPGALRVYSVATGRSDIPTSVPGRDIEFVGVFPTPTMSAPLTIIVVNGGVLELRSDDGETFTFNLQTLEFP